jgi:tetratricopeptide (TPR) repeat protein
MHKAGATKITLLSIIFLFKISFLLSASHFQVDSLLNDLIFNARYDQAIVIAQKEINAGTDPYSKLHFLLKISEIYTYKNNPEKAIEILKEVFVNQNSATKYINETDFLYCLDMAMVLRKSGKNTEGIQWLKKSEFFLKKLKNPWPADVARLYLLLGKSSYEKRDSVNAIRYFSKSIHVLSENSLPEKTAKLTSLSYLQLAYLFSGNIRMAKRIEAKTDSVLHSIVNKNHPSLFNFYLNLSFIYLNYKFNIHKAEDALDLASEIINKCCSSTDPDYGLLYCYKAQLAYQEHDSEKALGYFRQAETYLLKNQDLAPYMYLLYFDLANTYYFYVNDFQNAILNYKKVFENGNTWLKQSHNNSLVLSGYCYLELGDTLKAVSYIKKGTKATEEGYMVSNREVVYTYRCLAGFYLNIGQEEMAYRYFQKAYEKSLMNIVGWDLQADIITNLANYHRDKGDFQIALNLYQTAIDKAFNDTSDFTKGSLFCDETELIEIFNNKGYALYQLYEKKDKNIQHIKDALSCQKFAIRLIESRLGYLDNESSQFNWLEIVQTTFNNAVLYSTLLYNLIHDIKYADAGYQYAEKSRMMIILIASHNNNMKKFAGVPDSLINKEILLHN